MVMCLSKPASEVSKSIFHFYALDKMLLQCGTYLTWLGSLDLDWLYVSCSGKVRAICRLALVGSKGGCRKNVVTYSPRITTTTKPMKATWKGEKRKGIV